MVLKLLCIQEMIEDNTLLFQKGKTYEGYIESDNSIVGRSEIDQYVTISNSGNFQFRNYFVVI